MARGDDPKDLPDDLRWAADYFWDRGEVCGCDPSVNVICENCFNHSLLMSAAREIERLRTEVPKKAFLSGFIDGLREFAWWKDGVQYVGSCGTTLQKAIDRAKEESGQIL